MAAGSARRGDRRVRGLEVADRAAVARARPRARHPVAARARATQPQECRAATRISISMTATVAPAPQRHLTELTLEFLATLELERGLSRNTLEAYRSDLQQYGAFLGRAWPRSARRSSPSTCSSSSPSWPPGAKARRRSSAATLQRKIACLRSFYRHLRREQIIDHDPTAELRPPRSPGPAAEGPQP